MRFFVFLLSLSALMTACNSSQPAPAPAPAPADNTLTDAEKADGWKLLFNGKDLTGWHKYGGAPAGKMWTIDSNAIHLAAMLQAGHWQSSDGGDILTNDDFENFELRLDWKIDTCGNSGIIYHITEDTAKYAYPWMTGPEMQVLDNNCHPDGKIEKHRAADLYDLVKCSTEPVKPALQWNSIRLVSNRGHVEHWINGVKVVDVQMLQDGKPTEAWLKLIAGSKFPKLPAPDFGLSTKGKISLQDHGNKVWYKNIKIKNL